MVEFNFILQEVGNNINLIAVTESWYKDNGIQLSYLVAGFSLVTASRPERSAGGVAIYIRNNMEFYDSIIAIEVKCRGKTFDVASIYRAPRRKQQHVNTFFFTS
jgi:hypothetical protein